MTSFGERRGLLDAPNFRGGSLFRAFIGIAGKMRATLLGATPALAAVLPSFALAMTAASMLMAGVSRIRRLAQASPAGLGNNEVGRQQRNPEGPQGWAGSNQTVVIILQFLVGGLVTLGGIEFARNGTYPIGTVLGLIHLSVGLSGLATGFLVLRPGSWNPRNLVLAVNALTIAYSSFSESMVYVESLLGGFATDSLIGTIIAVLMSLAIIYLLSWKR